MTRGEKPESRTLGALAAVCHAAGLTVCAGVGLYAFHTSLGGQPLLRGKLLDD